MNKQRIKHFLINTFRVIVIFFLLSALAEADVLFDMASYTDANSSAVITLNDPNANTDPNSIQEVILQVESESDPNGISISAEETDINTDKFTANLSFTPDNSDDEKKLIQVNDEDKITVTYEKWTDTAEINFVDLDEPEESTNNDETPATPSISDSPGFTFGNHKGCFIDTAAAGLKALFH